MPHLLTVLNSTSNDTIFKGGYQKKNMVRFMAGDHCGFLDPNRVNFFLPDNPA